jgi:hypothetical protein
LSVQLGQLLVAAQWLQNNKLLSLQSRWAQTFGASMERSSNSKEQVPWPIQILQQFSGDHVRLEAQAEASMLVLGLVTSGTLIGLKALPELM